MKYGLVSCKKDITFSKITSSMYKTIVLHTSEDQKKNIKDKNWSTDLVGGKKITFSKYMANVQNIFLTLEDGDRDMTNGLKTNSFKNQYRT